MDAVPWNFVDSVVDLFSVSTTLEQLVREVTHPLWKNVVERHHRSRVYYDVFFRKTVRGMQHVFVNKADDASTRMIPKNERFARIMTVYDMTAVPQDDPIFDGVEQLGEEETGKLLETVAPMIDPVDGGYTTLYSPGLRHPACGKVLLSSFLNKVYLRTIKLEYCGQIAQDFLENQINNSPFLYQVALWGKDWPKSCLPLLRKFALKGIPGKRNAIVTRLEIPASYLQEFFDQWKTNKNPHFNFSFYGGKVDEFRTLINTADVSPVCSDSNLSVFKHETQKSMAFISDRSFVEFLICECDRFENCSLKERYLKYHNF
uniref:F-box domain-containing protein n=1 Tax=Steinernema glaseri TaxID=37863 RepID=A0A1I8A720_9BILA